MVADVDVGHYSPLFPPPTCRCSPPPWRRAFPPVTLQSCTSFPPCLGSFFTVSFLSLFHFAQLLSFFFPGSSPWIVCPIFEDEVLSIRLARAVGQSTHGGSPKMVWGPCFFFSGSQFCPIIKCPLFKRGFGYLVFLFAKPFPPAPFLGHFPSVERLDIRRAPLQESPTPDPGPCHAFSGVITFCPRPNVGNPSSVSNWTYTLRSSVAAFFPSFDGDHKESFWTSLP